MSDKYNRRTPSGVESIVAGIKRRRASVFGLTRGVARLICSFATRRIRAVNISPGRRRRRVIRRRCVISIDFLTASVDGLSPGSACVGGDYKPMSAIGMRNRREARMSTSGSIEPLLSKAGLLMLFR